MIQKTETSPVDTVLRLTMTWMTALLFTHYYHIAITIANLVHSIKYLNVKGDEFQTFVAVYTYKSFIFLNCPYVCRL